MMVDLFSFSIGLAESPLLRVGDSPLLQIIDSPLFEAAKIYLEIKNSALVEVTTYYANQRRAIEERTKQTHRDVQALAVAGWYLPFDLPVSLVSGLAAALKGDSSSQEQAHTFLETWMSARLEIAEHQLSQQFPERASIIAQAFDVHRLGKHAAAITLTLSLVDGVTFDLTGHGLFAKRETGGVQRVLRNHPRYMRSYLSPLLATYPLTENQSDAEPTDDTFNRHTIMHGRSWGYPTSRNSLKAFALLRFVAWILRELQKTRTAQG